MHALWLWVEDVYGFNWFCFVKTSGIWQAQTTATGDVTTYWSDFLAATDKGKWYNQSGLRHDKGSTPVASWSDVAFSGDTSLSGPWGTCTLTILDSVTT